MIETPLVIEKLFFLLDILSEFKQYKDFNFGIETETVPSLYYCEKNKHWIYCSSERGAYLFQEFYPNIKLAVLNIIHEYMPTTPISLDGLFHNSVSLDEYKKIIQKRYFDFLTNKNCYECKILLKNYERKNGYLFDEETDLFIKGDEKLKNTLNQLVLEYKSGYQSCFRFVFLAWKNYKKYINNN